MHESSLHEVPADRRRTMRGVVLRWVQIVLAAALITYIFRRWPLATFTDAVRTVAPGFFALAALLMIVKVWLEYRRWFLLMRLLEPDCKRTTVLVSHLIGAAGALVTPGGLGEHVRIAPFKNAGRMRALSLSCYDGVAWAGIATLFAAAGLACLPLSAYAAGEGAAPWAKMGLFIAIVITIAWECFLLGVAYAPQGAAAALMRVPWLAKRKLFVDMSEALTLVDRRSRQGVFMLAAGNVLVILLQFDLVMRGLGFAHHLSWAVMAVSALIRRMLPVTLGGIGIHEVSAAELMLPLGAAPQAAVTGMLVIFLVNRVTPALCGGLLIAMGHGREPDAPPVPAAQG